MSSPWSPAAGDASSVAAVRVVASTWARDSHELFDFEAQNLHTRMFRVQNSVVATRAGMEVDFQNPGSQLAEGTEPLVQVVERNGAFFLDRAPSASGSKKLWMVVRDMAPSGYLLREGDVMKLGRLKFRVRQLVTQPGVQPDLCLEDLRSCCQVDPKEQTSARTCRICLMEGPGEDDPLISPCECKGSIEFVHLKCLRHWTRNRLSFPDNALGSYFYRPLNCELCKSTYPGHLAVSSDGSREEPLMEVPRTEPPYIVLESVRRERLQTAVHGLHVISLAEKALTLGRGHDSIVRIADVSMSRCHASIRYENGAFLLEDNNSKFGTLIAMRRPRQLEAFQPVSLQIGRTVLSISLTPPGEAMSWESRRIITEEEIAACDEQEEQPEQQYRNLDFAPDVSAMGIASTGSPCDFQDVHEMPEIPRSSSQHNTMTTFAAVRGTGVDPTGASGGVAHSSSSGVGSCTFLQHFLSV